MNISVEKSLFSRVFSYRRRENRLPEEDFFTETFVGVMEKEPDLLKELFEELTGNEVNDVTISSQVSYASTMANGGIDRPDIQMIGKGDAEVRHIIFIESKLSSTEGYEQLNRYAKLLEDRHAKLKTLIYITQFPDEPKDIKVGDSIVFKQMRWYKIYQFFKKRNTVGPFVKELIKFMEELNMTFDIKLSELLAGVSFARLQGKLWNLLDEAWNQSGLKDNISKGKGRQPYYNGEIAYGTPAMGKDGLMLYYGIWFDTKDKSPYNFTFDNPELPVLYLAISKWPKKETKNTYNKYKKTFDLLTKEKKNWELIDDFEGHIARKSRNINFLGRDDLSHELLKFFTEAFSEIKDAPFLNK